MQKLVCHLLYSRPNSPFVCSYHCVTSAMGAAHISPARPVIKLKVSSINHSRLLLFSSLVPILFSLPGMERFVSFVNYQLGLVNERGYAHYKSSSRHRHIKKN